MCGITGAVALRRNARPDATRVWTMSHCLAHRGPDAAGRWVAPSGHAVLAHRRLSIIDRTAGGQPMVDAAGGACPVFNGEIYNYCELRDALRCEGARFVTASDTEVLLALLQRRGAAGVEALRGMFAFALWDDVAGQLLVARDPVGKKPFYYTVAGGCLYFASSLQALATAFGTPWPLDVEALDQYFTLGYVPAPRTIYQGVWKLPASTMASVAVDAQIDDGGSLPSCRYWDLARPDAAPDGAFTGSFADAVDATEALLRDAVRRGSIRWARPRR